jgi:glycosyltransferase involved in cell wall biosynthesis
MKVAIVHDWLTIYGGSESIVRILHEMFPDAPIYTTVYDKKNMPEDFARMDIRPSFLQKYPFAKKKYTMYLPFMPRAFESFDLSQYDLVVSSNTSCSKGVLTGANTLHICYCNTPMRYGWDFYHEYIREKGRLGTFLISCMMKKIRLWDRLSADRVDLFIANSHNVARRIRKHYRRDSHVIYPPVRTQLFTPGTGETEGDYFLAVSRLVPYKRIDLLVEAFSQLGLPLKIIGDGSERKQLEKNASSNIQFLGRLEDDKVLKYMQGARAFLFPGEEDFGITPIEAQACGVPVIAYGKGGALETVEEGKTGLFFWEQTASSLTEAVRAFDGMSFDKAYIAAHAEKFSEERFRRELKTFLLDAYKEFEERRNDPFCKLSERQKTV